MSDVALWNTADHALLMLISIKKNTSQQCNKTISVYLQHQPFMHRHNYLSFDWQVHFVGIRIVTRKTMNKQFNSKALFEMFWIFWKEYPDYEIVGESRPLSAFFPTHVDLFTEMHFMKLSNPPKFLSVPSPNCFTIDVWNINCWRQQFISYLSYCFFLYRILRHFTRVL